MASEFNGGVKLAPVDDASRARGAAATFGRSSIVIFALILLSVGAFFGLVLAAAEAGWRIGRAPLAGTAGALAKGAGSAEAGPRRVRHVRECGSKLGALETMR